MGELAAFLRIRETDAGYGAESGAPWAEFPAGRARSGPLLGQGAPLAPPFRPIGPFSRLPWRATGVSWPWAPLPLPGEFWPL